MLLRTHLAITGFFVLLFFEAVEYKVAFLIMAVVGTYLPDVDSRYSRIGRKWINRVLQAFTRHRGVLHSFLFLFTLVLFFVLFWPIGAFGFFLGYSLHLFADSFTLEGIQPFYPFKKKIQGKLKTGSRFETGLFVGFVIGGLGLLAGMFF